ncbi:MAG TPA: tRNA-dihydrouridine synthase, partial [Patescibacteria group bacterium]|nr:tRNA-dihydrouridine synthase [Patescibacteria group bacterium]
ASYSMITGFWKQLKLPIYGLAPMANVTDAAFRRIIAKYGKPDVMWTEFVACDGLQSPGRDKLLVDFMYSEIERPIVAQIFGSKPENFYKTALLIQELGFDGIDINMGCPDKNVLKQGAGGALIKTPKLAQEIIEATKRGAGKLPISIKTRVGFNKTILNEWLPYLLEMEPAAITIHARTCKELSLVPARWEHVAEAVQMRDRYAGQGGYQSAPTANRTLILGNGDVKDIADANEKISATGADGVMIGRGIFGNPWLFRDRHANDQGVYQYAPTIMEKLQVMTEHTKLYEELISPHKNFDIMKKHYKAYVNGFDGAKELRIKLMETKNAAEVEKIVNNFLIVTSTALSTTI